MTSKKALKFGGHALVWAGDWSEASARKAAVSAKKAGYDYIEMLMIEPEKIDVVMTKEVLAEHGLFATASLGLSPETDVTSTNPSIVKKGDELLRKVVDKLHAIGSTELCGVIYCSLGKYPGPASAENRANSISAVTRLADYAADKGINVNFVKKEEHGIRVRTYERGVEDETLSCGTGVTAAAIASSAKMGQQHINVQVEGGALAVSFNRIAEKHFTDIWLIGPATFVYSGNYSANV